MGLEISEELKFFAKCWGVVSGTFNKGEKDLFKASCSYSSEYSDCIGVRFSDDNHTPFICPYIPCSSLYLDLKKRNVIVLNGAFRQRALDLIATLEANSGLEGFVLID